MMRGKEGFMSSSDKLPKPTLSAYIWTAALCSKFVFQGGVSRQDFQRDNHAPRTRDMKDIRKNKG